MTGIPPYFDAQGNPITQAQRDAQLKAGTGGRLGILQYSANASALRRGQRVGTALAEADALAEAEGAEYEAAANREAADRTNSLAQQLATARRTPGGGIRLGMRRRGKGLSASSVTGLNRANATERMSKRKNLYRAQVAKQFANEQTGGLSVSFGTPITI